MLQELTIQNYTIIDHLHIDFHAGFSVITGETGAGKSIILGAISLLTGNRADPKALRKADKKCIVEAVFNIQDNPHQAFFDENDIESDGQECILRREIQPSGKSRAFINDTPVSLQQMREITEHLIDIHSQHQNLLLQQEDFQLQVLDTVAQDQPLLQQYDEAYQTLRKAERQLAEEQQKLETARQQEEFLRFQHTELTQARLSDGEEEQLEEAVNTLSHAEEIKESLYQAAEQLDNEQGVITRLKLIDSHVAHISAVYPALQQLPERIEALLIEAKDIREELQTHLNKVDFNPEELDQMQLRLDQLQTLKAKYKVASVAELIAIHSQLTEQISHLDDSEAHLDDLQKAVTQSKAACVKLAKSLTQQRQQAAKTVEQHLANDLKELGMPKVKFQVELTSLPEQLSAHGADSIRFLFSANNTALQPISQIASGGEIARVMLCLKALLTNAQHQPTIIFDEIDTGVSGAIAERMALIMQQMGQQERQVMAITHLPQIAARGQHHYLVLKTETADGTTSQMKELETDERIQAVAQMLSGVNVTAAAVQQAKELLQQQ